MQFFFYRKREKFLDYFRPRKRVMVSYSRTFFGSGFKTHVASDERLAKEGEVEKIIDSLAGAAEQRGSGVPFALSESVLQRLDKYDVKIRGLATAFPRLFEKSGRDAGIVMDGSRYITADSEEE